MAYLSSRSFGADVPFGLPAATAGEVIHPRVRKASRLVEREWSAVPEVMFALQMGVGAAVAAGTILALFAWSGAGL